MGKGVYLRQDFYKKAMNKYEGMLVTIENMKSRKERVFDIAAYIDSTNIEIAQILADGHTETLKNVAEKVSHLKHEYSTKREYVDPQLETLQRQDWDMKLSNMTDSEVFDYIIDVLDDNLLSVYQLGALKKRVKEIDAPNINKSLLETKMSQYETKYNIGEEYKNTEEYNELMQLQSECVSYGKYHLWKYDIANDKNEIIDFRSAKNLLGGYDVYFSL